MNKFVRLCWRPSQAALECYRLNQADDSHHTGMELEHTSKTLSKLCISLGPWNKANRILDLLAYHLSQTNSLPCQPNPTITQPICKIWMGTMITSNKSDKRLHPTLHWLSSYHNTSSSKMSAVQYQTNPEC